MKKLSISPSVLELTHIIGNRNPKLFRRPLATLALLVLFHYSKFTRAQLLITLRNNYARIK